MVGSAVIEPLLFGTLFRVSCSIYSVVSVKLGALAALVGLLEVV